MDMLCWCRQSLAQRGQGEVDVDMRDDGRAAGVIARWKILQPWFEHCRTLVSGG